MIQDPIVEEIHAIRAAIAKEFGYDLRKYVEYLQQEQKKHGARLVKLQPRRSRAARRQKKAG